MKSLRARIEALESPKGLDFSKLTDQELGRELIRTSMELAERGVQFSAAESEDLQQLLQRIDPDDEVTKVIERLLMQGDNK